MKHQSTKKLFAFIITVMIFSLMPASVNAQKKCTNGHCPKGYTCVDGYCVKSGGGGCNCFVRPIPFECGQICGFKTNGTTINGTTFTNIYSSVPHSVTISFSNEQAEKIAVGVYDMTGRLVKTLADKMLEQGNHELLWDAAGVNAGIYLVQFNSGTYRETKKISVIKL